MSEARLQENPRTRLGGWLLYKEHSVPPESSKKQKRRRSWSRITRLIDHDTSKSSHFSLFSQEERETLREHPLMTSIMQTRDSANKEKKNRPVNNGAVDSLQILVGETHTASTTRQVSVVFDKHESCPGCDGINDDNDMFCSGETAIESRDYANQSVTYGAKCRGLAFHDSVSLLTSDEDEEVLEWEVVDCDVCDDLSMTNCIDEDEGAQAEGMAMLLNQSAIRRLVDE